MQYISRADIDFLLHRWLAVDGLLERPQLAGHTRETIAAVLDLSEKLAASHFADHYKAADRDEPRLVDGKVVLHPGIARALAAYREAGFFSAAFGAEVGGMQLPMLASAASFAIFTAANIATAAYPLLTGANARLLLAHGAPAQIETWALPQIAGRYLGTMCLSEPQAGSSLSDIATRAVPDGEDAYGARHRLTGSKMWISGGDHEISDNIAHLVLAKVPDASGRLVAGVKGVSLFIVPKRLPDGTRNDVAVAGLNHKMGYRGTVNCLLNFGEREGAVGWRVGEAGQGLAIMFHMMNEARILIGLGGAALACRGYLQSLRYAGERAQGRPVSGATKDAASPQLPIIRHADVRRMLLAQKAYAEGALALVLLCARLFDDTRTLPEAGARRNAHALLELLTPVAKSWPAEWGLAANDLAIQIHGGYGYTRDFEVEQIWRDNRLNPIHEGTNGIQAIDLVGRKIFRDPASLELLAARVADTVRRAVDVDALAPLAPELAAAWRRTAEVAGALNGMADRGRALDNASLFLTAFGHVVVAWIWLDMALVAHQPAHGGEALPAAFVEGKRRACAYFFRHVLPKIDNQLKLVAAADDCAATMPVESF